VREWVEQVRNSGITIPDIPALNLGGCPNNTDAAAKAGPQGNCWWTCGHCTRSTDIVSCADKLTWGVSFDDGPSPYTPNLLQYLDQIDVKSTFFVVGSRALSRPQILQDQYMGGHQISVHTWSHTDMVTQSTEAIVAELGWTMKIIKGLSIVLFQVRSSIQSINRRPWSHAQYFPSSIWQSRVGKYDTPVALANTTHLSDRVRSIAKAMGLTPIIWTRANNFTFDTNDFNVNGGTVSPSQVLVNVRTISQPTCCLFLSYLVPKHPSSCTRSGHRIHRSRTRSFPSNSGVGHRICLASRSRQQSQVDLETYH
jgi:hypothetical protein